MASFNWHRLILNLLLATAVFVICFITYSVLKKKEHVYALNIYGVNCGVRDTITVGNTKGTILADNKNIPDNVFVATRSEAGFHYTLKDGAYVKLNDTTLNKILLNEGDVIVYKDSSISFTDIKRRLSSYPKQHNFLLDDIWEQPFNIAADHSGNTGDMSRSLLYCNKEGPFYKKEKKWYIIIRDNNTVLRRNGEEKRQILSGIIAGEQLKVQLIDVRSSIFVKKEEPLFKNRNIDPPTVRTEWQAAHILIKHDAPSGKNTIFFSQPLSVVFNDALIDSITRRSGTRTMLVSQEHTFMEMRTLYFERFSDLFPLPVITVIKNDTPGKTAELLYVNENKDDPEQGILKKSSLHGPATDFNILSPVNSSASVFGKFLYMGEWHLLLPFFILAAIVIICCVVLFLLTNPQRYKYYHLLASIKRFTDFDELNIDSHTANKTFWYLRMPVMLLVFILLCCKLILLLKLSFTHPYFPQLLFIGSTMAFSTPVFITFFFIRNSWQLPEMRNHRIFHIPMWLYINVGFLLSTICVFYISWNMYGASTYQYYFDAYNVEADWTAIVTDFITKLPQTIATPVFKHTIYEEKLLQIPLMILVLPLILIVYDIFSSWLRKLGAKRLPKGVLSSFILSNDILIVLCIIMAARQCYSYSYIALILFIYLSFKSLTNISDSITTNTRLFSSLWWNKQPTSIKLPLYFLCTCIKKWSFWWKSIVLAVVILIPTFGYGDTGFFISYSLIPPFFVFFALITIYSHYFENYKSGFIKKIVIPLVPILSILIFINAHKFSKPTIQDLSRSDRRISSIIQRDEALETGGRQYLGDIQFLDIARINAIEFFNTPSFKLIDHTRPFHKLISKGLFPVIINDLNPLVLMDYGGGWILAMLLITWLCLLLNRRWIWMSKYNIQPKHFDTDLFNFTQVLRYVPALIIVGNSVWLFLSLFNIVFFTGRIVNGFGMDGFVDWVDLVILSSLMGTVIFNSKNGK